MAFNIHSSINNHGLLLWSNLFYFELVQRISEQRNFNKFSYLAIRTKTLMIMPEAQELNNYDIITKLL